ncbi:MAG: ABC transporter ATP-binding protein, partial [Haloarculaceae archaeon]
ELRSLAKRFGSVTAVDDVSLSVPAGERHAIIGPNGAGKTTLFDLVAGATEPDAGRVRHRGTDVTNLSESTRARHGIVRSFQLVELFDGLPVRENLALAVRAGGARLTPFGSPDPAVAERALEWCSTLDLGSHRETDVADLSHGDRKRLEVGTALATGARTLLLDEPTSGMPRPASERLLDLVAETTADRTVLVIEHDVDAALAFADRVSVMDRGSVIARGPPDEVVTDEAVQQAYLRGYDVPALD